MTSKEIETLCNLTLEKLHQDFAEVKKDLFQTGRACTFLLGECLLDLQKGNRCPNSLILIKVTSLVDFASEKLHSFIYQDVPTCWRQLHTDASLIKGICEVQIAFDEEKSQLDSTSSWKQVIKTLDMTLLLSGAPGKERKELILHLIEAVNVKLRNISDKNEKFIHRKVLQNETPSKSCQLPIINHPITRLMVPSILSFTSHVTSERPTPLIIESSIAYWPALSTRPWANLDYLLEAAGEERIVPVEIGAKYTDQKWSQKLMSFGDFLRKCTESSYIDEEMKSSDIFYLAQHDLFEQIPRLKEDISIPDYCFVDTLTSVAINSTSNVYYQPPSDVIINAWLGPKGTISPMHTDPYHNLLAQVVGKKYIRLYGPEETPNVYPFAQDNFLKNTSQVDIESPDYSQFPKFPSAHYVECVLSPGELLYIPPGWWHYVRSLSVSFSVSFWF